MSSLLEAANVESNKIEVTDQLPKHMGDISIMTIEQLSNALKKSDSDNSICACFDPTASYAYSTYYVYGIAGDCGVNSTAEKLQAVGSNWYKQLHMPNNHSQTFTCNSNHIFGGPLKSVFNFSDAGYIFSWHYYYNGNSDDSGHSRYWNGAVASSVCVAVICAHE